jgi:hypothetical protein
VKVLRRARPDTDDSGANKPKPDHAVGSGDAGTPSRTDTTPAGTPGKGRPTPKRREAQARRRGPVAPAPMTAKEARARKRAERGTREQRKQASADRRAAAAERRERMAAGDERYLLPKDKGPVRAYVRDLVDSRRSLVGMFMPLAVVLLIVLYGGMVFGKSAQLFVTLVMVIMMIFMAGDGLLLGRMVNKRARERFPKHTERPLSLGWYAFVRASQLRRLRLPKPRVSLGDTV